MQLNLFRLLTLHSCPGKETAGVLLGFSWAGSWVGTRCRCAVPACAGTATPDGFLETTTGGLQGRAREHAASTNAIAHEGSATLRTRAFWCSSPRLKSVK